MDRFDIQKLRELPIESVAERLGLKVSKHKSLCPFHDDRHPSLSFHRASNTYKCFVCDAHGDVISLAMHVLGKTFYETCKWLADNNNIIISEDTPPPKQGDKRGSHKPDVEYLSHFFRQPQLNAEAQRFLFNERHYDPKVIHWLGITSISQPTPCWRYGKPYYDAPSLLFPYRDVDGKLLNVQSRYLGTDKSKPRFRFPSGSECHIFGLQILRYLKQGDPLYISEGITDCIAHLSSGHKAIAIPSATLLKAEDLKPLETLKLKLGNPVDLHIYPDRDEAGERLYKQLATLTAAIGCLLVKHNLPEGCKDYSDYWVQQASALKPSETS